MKMFRMFFATAISIALCFNFTACSDDDENGDEENNSGVVNPSKVFTGGLPKSVLGMSISQNKDGLVTNITTDDGEKAVFEYSFATRAAALVNTAKITVTDEDGETTILNLKLNDNGYVESCNSIDPGGETFTWSMEYDTDGHLVVMRRSESGGEITNITYKNGDVVKTSTLYTNSGDLNGDGVIDDKDKDEYSATIDYTTDAITSPIENKGCLMLFDETLDVDMDEMIYAYYAGMLGKATKHLPLLCHEVYGEFVYDDVFTWTLNSSGYPTKLLVKEADWEDNFSFSW